MTERDKLDRAIAALQGGAVAAAKPMKSAQAAPKKRKVSAASRRRMALGQKKRWAVKAVVTLPGVESGVPTKKTAPLWSAAKKKAQGERMKAFWAAKKKAAKK